MKAAVLHNFGVPLSVEQVTDPAIGTAIPLYPQVLPECCNAEAYRSVPLHSIAAAIPAARKKESGSVATMLRWPTLWRGAPS